MDMQLFQYDLLKRLYKLHWIVSAPPSKTNGHICVDLFLDYIFRSLDCVSFCLPVLHYLDYNSFIRNLGYTDPTHFIIFLFFISKRIIFQKNFRYYSVFAFRYKFYHNFVYIYKNLAGNLIRSALSIYINLGITS